MIIEYVELILSYNLKQLQTKIVKQTKRGARHKTMYKCKICFKTFQKPSQLMRHIRVHTGDKPFKVWEKITFFLIMLSNQLFISLLTSDILLNKNLLLLILQCTICSRKFTQKGSLQIHVKQHDGLKPHACHFCNAKFSQKGIFLTYKLHRAEFLNYNWNSLKFQFSMILISFCVIYKI